MGDNEERELQPGEWVAVQAQVIDPHFHPDDLLVQFRSHNEEFEAPVLKRRAKPCPRPDDVEQCGALGEFGDLLARCMDYDQHPLGVHRNGERSWSDDEVVGWFGDR